MAAKKKTMDDVRFMYSKATMDFKEAYNNEIDKIIKQLEDIKIKDDTFSVKDMQGLGRNLSRVNSLANRRNVEKAYTRLYDSATIDLQNCVDKMSKSK